MSKNNILKKKSIALFILAVGVLSISLFLKKGGSGTGTNLLQQVAPTTIPMEYLSMTIPYLRSKTYDGKLGKLEKVAENSSYSSYLTSYISDNLKINGLLTIPKDEGRMGKSPAIVFVHGYIAPSEYETLERYTDYVDFLASSGFVVFKIDLRGHGDSEGDATGGYYSSGYVVDTLNAYSALQNASFVDSKKIGLWGHSMAGNVLMRAFAAKPDIPAVVIWAGAGFSYADLAKYGLSDSSYRPPQSQSARTSQRQKLFDTVGRFNPSSIFWKQVAPTNYLADLQGAIQLHHAVDDDVVNIGYSRDLNMLLEETSIPHDFYEYDAGGHNISGNSFTQAMQRTVEFFNTYLK